MTITGARVRMTSTPRAGRDRGHHVPHDRRWAVDVGVGATGGSAAAARGSGAGDALLDDLVFFAPFAPLPGSWAKASRVASMLAPAVLDPAFPWPQHYGQRLARAIAAVVGEAGQRVAERLLPRRSRLFLLQHAVTIVVSRSTVTRRLLCPAPRRRPPPHALDRAQLVARSSISNYPPTTERMTSCSARCAGRRSRRESAERCTLLVRGPGSTSWSSAYSQPNESS